MAEAPFSWEKFDVIGSGVLYRALFTKKGGSYAAWVMAFNAPTGNEMTRVAIDVGEMAAAPSEAEPTEAP